MAGFNDRVKYSVCIGNRCVNEIINVVILDFIGEMPLTVVPRVSFNGDRFSANQIITVKQFFNNEFSNKLNVFQESY